jgi:hypothetical protein
MGIFGGKVSNLNLLAYTLACAGGLHFLGDYLGEQCRTYRFIQHKSARNRWKKARAVGYG